MKKADLWKQCAKNALRDAARAERARQILLAQHLRNVAAYSLRMAAREMVIQGQSSASGAL